MENQNSAAQGTFFRELFHFGAYKRNQGRTTRYVTGIAVFLVFLIGAVRVTQVFDFEPRVYFGIWAIVPAIGAWLGYRLVNLPSFADFLIAVEAEMTKVSWPSRIELFHSVIVVIFSLVMLGVVLAFYDVFWVWALRVLGVTK